MISYSHSDVRIQLLHMGMTKFRDIFKSLDDESGQSIGVDPFHHLTIAGVAFEGVFCKYFLLPEMIRIVPRPLKSNYPIKQFFLTSIMLWMGREKSDLSNLDNCSLTPFKFKKR